MAEGYDHQAYDHIPQRSRRDKLRVLSALQVEEPGAIPNYNFHNMSSSGSFPLFDPSLIPSAAGNNCVIKEERSAINHFMGFPGNCIMMDHDDHHQSPTNLPINSNPFLNYPPENLQTLRDLNEMMVFNKLPEPLSLSLSSRPLEEPNLQRYGPSGSIYNAESCRPAGSSVPLGPFTGYASILKASRFLKPVQQLLEEFCEVEGQGSIHVNEKIVADPGLTEYSSSFDYHCGDGGDDQGEGGRKKSRLISMLDEVCRRYKQYFQQMQAVVASFECVPGLGNATPYVTLAMKSMSKHFKYLKNAISDQHQFTNKAASSHSYSQRPTHNTGLFLDNQPVWRPQRGLPERAVNVLRAWLFEHFLHPYPTDSDKLMLAKQTGLSRSQVSNWFINARVRLWKPMVEEIHMLETRQSQKASQSEGQNANQTSSSLASHHQNMSTSTQPHALNSKRNRNELTNYNITTANEEMQNLCYSNFPHHASMAGGGSVGSNGGVSLTLGLQQNINGIGGGQGYGLGLHEVVDREGYVVMSGFHEAQNRHFGRDVIGGQLLHDFVG